MNCPIVEAVMRRLSNRSVNKGLLYIRVHTFHGISIVT